MDGRIRRMLSVGLIVTMCGCNQDADRLGRICHKVAAKFTGATEGVRDKLHTGAGAVRSSLSETSFDSRVALRLRWDTVMNGAEVSVRAAGPGVVELHGHVADLPQERRAVALAATTAGIDKVIDLLTVEADADKPR